MDYGGSRAGEGEPCDKRVCVGADELFKKGANLVRQRTQQDAASASGPSSSSGTSSSRNAPATTGSSTTEDERPDGNGRGCPEDKDSLGRASWSLLHSMSVHYPEKPREDDKATARTFLSAFSKMYPCDVCAEDLRADLVQHPPALDSRDAFAGWMCMLHNRVNEKTGKPAFDCSKVFERWRDGWKDGSCD